jgi:two-component system chemotaxis response regulator CheB
MTSMAGARSGELVVMAASTGGPGAVQSVLQALPASLDAAVVVALHMPGRFTAPYAHRLDAQCGLVVQEAVDGAPLKPGHCLVLPGGQQASVGQARRIRLRPQEAGELYAPSADLLMKSAAAALGPKVVGVVLTGMGEDGAEGLLAIRAAGGFTLAESRDSAVVYGMPGGAVRRGAAGAELRLEEMAGALVARCGLRLLPPTHGSGV